jgi:hypothetical protein
VTAVQATDAQIKAPLLAEVTNATVAVSAHPTSGERPTADDMLPIIEYLVAPSGKEPSRWAGEDMQRVFELVRDSPFNLCANAYELAWDAVTTRPRFSRPDASVRA